MQRYNRVTLFLTLCFCIRFRCLKEKKNQKCCHRETCFNLYIDDYIMLQFIIHRNTTYSRYKNICLKIKTKKKKKIKYYYITT